MMCTFVKKIILNYWVMYPKTWVSFFQGHPVYNRTWTHCEVLMTDWLVKARMLLSGSGAMILCGWRGYCHSWMGRDTTLVITRLSNEWIPVSKFTWRKVGTHINHPEKFILLELLSHLRENRNCYVECTKMIKLVVKHKNMIITVFCIFFKQFWFRYFILKTRVFKWTYITKYQCCTFPLKYF